MAPTKGPQPPQKLEHGGHCPLNFLLCNLNVFLQECSGHAVVENDGGPECA